MKQTPKRNLRCGPGFLTQASGNNVIPWNRLDQKMTLYLCESARRALRQLHGPKRPHLVAKPERPSAPVLQEGAES
jgi:hypothetical protein